MIVSRYGGTMNVGWISEALSDIDDTGLVDVFGYSGMRYRFSGLREIYWVWEYAKLLAVSC